MINITLILTGANYFSRNRILYSFILFRHFQYSVLLISYRILINYPINSKIQNKQNNKQNYMNPETQQLFDLSQIKRKIQFQNYNYNQQQLQQKSQKSRSYKKRQKHQSVLMNQIALDELQREQQRQIRKKYHVQNVLQKEYQQQIDWQKRIRTEERSFDKVYCKMEREMLDDYQKSRVKQLGQIYNTGSATKKQIKPYLKNRNLLTQGSLDSLDVFKQQILADNKVKNHQQRRIKQIGISFQPSPKQQFDDNNFRQNRNISTANNIQQDQRKQQSYKSQQMYKAKQSYKEQYDYKQDFGHNKQLQDFQLRKESIIPQNSNQPRKQSLPEYSSSPIQDSSGQKKYTATNLYYSDYLKSQIERRQKQKQQQKHKQLQKDRRFIQRQTKSYYQNLEQMKYRREKKKWDYASGLQKQIRRKQQILKY